MKQFSFLVYTVFLFSCGTKEKKESNAVTNNNVTIAYNMSGDGDTTLFFIHGWSIDKGYWKAQTDSFSKRYRVVAIDLGGHGASGKNRTSWTIPDYANDVIAVIKTLELKNVVLIGHSMSGDVMLEVMRQYPKPVIALIGIDNFNDINPNPFTPEQTKSIDNWMKDLKHNYDVVAADYCKTSLFPADYADTSSVNRVIRSVINMDSTIPIATLQSLLEFTPKEASLLADIALPIHLIMSSETPQNEESLKKYCKAGYVIKKVEGTGHYPMIEKPVEFNTVLQEILNEL